MNLGTGMRAAFELNGDPDLTKLTSEELRKVLKEKIQFSQVPAFRS
jgi:hypothetical protein